MSYNGSGTFQINTSGQPVVTGTSISSTVFNALTADLATGLSTAITKDGQTTTTARIPFALGINSTLVTDATNTTSGSIITAGGVGIAKALYVGTTANVAGAVTLGGVATFSAQPIFSSLTASSAVATDASKGLVSVTNTGTGNNVLATTPTIATPSISSPTISDGTANGVAYLNGSKVLTTGSALVFDGTNLGVGVTPSAWSSTFKGFQLGSTGSIWSISSGNGGTYYGNNYIYGASGRTYLTTGTALELALASGAFQFGIAASGTAGNPVTFTQAMTLKTGTYGGQQLLLNTTAVGNAGTSGTLVGSRLSVGVIPYSGSAYGCIRIQDTSNGTAFLSEWGILADGDGNPSTTISYQVGLYLCAGINGGTAKIYFDGSGNAYKSSGAGSWSALSDLRIKTNVQSVSDGLSRILQLNPVTFNYKSPEAHNGKVNDKGFIADDFMQVYPNSVTETTFVDAADKQYIEEGTKAKALTFNAEFYADLVSAIQEQQAFITTLTDRITALEARNG